MRAKWFQLSGTPTMDCRHGDRLQLNANGAHSLDCKGRLRPFLAPVCPTAAAVPSVGLWTSRVLYATKRARHVVRPLTDAICRRIFVSLLACLSCCYFDRWVPLCRVRACPTLVVAVCFVSLLTNDQRSIDPLAALTGSLLCLPATLSDQLFVNLMIVGHLGTITQPPPAADWVHSCSSNCQGPRLCSCLK